MFAPTALGFGGALTYTACTGNYVDSLGDRPCVATNPADAVSLPVSVTVSPDGANVYAASENGNALDIFTRDPSTGTLTYDNCIGDLTGCVGTTPSTALDSVDKVIISRDGKYVYASTNPNSSGVIDEFSRGSGGALTFIGCLGILEGCTHSSPGYAIDGPLDLALSPDGSDLYVANYYTGLAALARDPVTGLLSLIDCAGNASGCPVSTAAPEYSMVDLRSVAVSPDGQNVYVSADSPGSVIDTLSRASNGAVAWVGCIGDLPSNETGCAKTNPPLAGQEADSMVLSPDGRTLYAGSYESNVASFARDPLTGLLTLTSCIGNLSGCTPTVPATALQSVNQIVLSANDANAYAASDDGSVGEFSIANPGGVLSFEGCVGDLYGCNNTGIVFAVVGEPRGLAISPDDTNVYVAAGSSQTIDQFDRPADAAGNLRVNELRLTGPADHPDDVYVDLYNAGATPMSLSGWTVNWATASGATGSTALTGANLPGGVLGAGAHYLLAQDSAYSLGSVAAPDQDLGLPSDSGGLTGVWVGNAGQVSDSVGYVGSSFGGNTGLTEPSYPKGDASEVAFVRRFRDGAPIDTGDNQADFVLVAPDARTQGYGQPAATPVVLGTPSPSDSGSPVQVNAVAQSYLLDPAVGEGVSPNLVYEPPTGPVSASNPGVLLIGRTIANVSTSQAITRLQVRITELSTYGTESDPLVGDAGDPGAVARLVDISTPTSSGSPLAGTDALTLGGTGLGGVNSVLEVPLPASTGTTGANPCPIGVPNCLAPGSLVGVTIAFDVDRSGQFAFGYNAEDDLKPDPHAAAGTMTPTGAPASAPAASAPAAPAPVSSALEGTVTPAGVTVTGTAKSAPASAAAHAPPSKHETQKTDKTKHKTKTKRRHRDRRRAQVRRSHR